MSYRVLITGAGTTTAITALKGLRAAGDAAIQVVMGDMKADCAGAHLGDEFVLMPPAQAPDFIERVLGICRDRRIDLVIPIIDYEFIGWARAAGRLAEAGTQVAISPVAALRTCEEKDQTERYFRSLGIPAVATWRAEAIHDPTALPFPVYLKPRCGRASLDNYRAQDPEEYRFYVKQVPDAIVQPFVAGTEVTIDTMSDLRGRFLAASPRIRLEVKSGQAYRSRTIDDPNLVALARRIVEGLPIHGPSNIQCFLTDSGPRFFEINARFGAGSILSIRAGMNGPMALVALARGQALPDLTPRPGVMMLRYWQEVFVPKAE
ncbi:MAG TPA: ATP-grasp domain-containing protein [Isosphaeraceae bacterium]|nr:ATP-grasp domain-containing protein [Isosphaeraceae bacterium]